jgi:AraC family transcriptional regulator of adaptative response/methylated-DNA-[protein]-cysteine methyltransferase
MISMSSSSATAIAMTIRPAPPATLAPRIDADRAWRELLARDRRAQFFYGVATTGVFCRPGCASRRPRRENVRFFLTAAEAAAAGFRPCQRCKPSIATAPGSPLGTACGTIASSTTACGSPLEKIRAYIEENYGRKIKLEELGRIAGWSPFTVQRLFKREMGASPLEYQRALKAGALRASLKKKTTVTDAIYNAGFGSPSRAYEGATLGMTPQRFAKGGHGERIGWCSAPSPFGWVIVGATGRGLCWLSLAATKAEAAAELRAEFPAAELRRDASLNKWIEAAVASVCSSTPLVQKVAPPQVHETEFDLRGTVFQLRVWQALKRIPRGQTLSYSELAREIGAPNSTRAVARACAMNRVAIFVPCHRVVGASGALTGYRWGVERKRKLLAAERAGIS